MCSMKRDEMIDYGRKHSMEPTPWIECKKVLFECFTILANLRFLMIYERLKFF